MRLHYQHVYEPFFSRRGTTAPFTRLMRLTTKEVGVARRRYFTVKVYVTGRHAAGDSAYIYTTAMLIDDDADARLLMEMLPERIRMPVMPP